MQGGSSVIVTCATQQPYRHCLEVASGGSDGPADVTIKGIAFEHSSKSVANNYCVYAQVEEPDHASVSRCLPTTARVSAELAL